MANLSPSPKLQFFDANGVPLVGGKLYSYAAGTTTPLATYTSAAETTFNTNPIILNARGETEVWLGSPLYKFKLTTAADVEIWTVDNIGAAQIADAAVTTAKLADAAVTTAKLADASVTMAKLIFDGSAISGALNFAPEVDVASAGTTDIGAAASNNVRITGTTTITSFGTAANGITRQLRFAAALTLTYNATSLILPGGANIIAAAGDTATAVSLGSGNWVVVDYTAATTAGARAVIGAAPQPQTATGVGRFEAVDTSASVGNGYSLPAGGTWAYFMFRVNSSTGGVPGGSNMAAGVAAGGTTILAGLASHFIYGFAWRIA